MNVKTIIICAICLSANLIKPTSEEQQKRGRRAKVRALARRSDQIALLEKEISHLASLVNSQPFVSRADKQCAQNALSFNSRYTHVTQYQKCRDKLKCLLRKS